MKTYIYMSHRIRDRNPAAPVIAVLRGKRLRYGNNVTICGPSKVIFRKRGLAKAPHHVRAWIETFAHVGLEK